MNSNITEISDAITSAAEPRILVIGAGVAGSVCGIELARRGIQVEIVEKATFPRAKTCGCCLGGAGIAALKHLNLFEDVRSVSNTTNKWLASFDGQPIQLDSGDGLACSRESLDVILLERARDLGAKAFANCQASIIEVCTDQVLVELKHEPGTNNETSSQQASKTEPFDVVILAGGLRSGDATGVLPWTEKPNGPFGVSFFADCPKVDSGAIYMACDDDGYVGLVRLSDGRVDVASALQSGSSATAKGSPIQRVLAILDRSHFDFDLRNPTPMMTTPPLRRTRQAGSGRVLAVGDAAGYVEPFTGEGMTWAMQSGIAAAETIASSMPNLDTVGQRWDTELKRLLRTKKLTCRAVTSSLRSPLARQSAVRALSLFPSLASPLIRHLSK